MPPPLGSNDGLKPVHECTTGLQDVPRGDRGSFERVCVWAGLAVGLPLGEALHDKVDGVKFGAGEVPKCCWPVVCKVVSR